MENNIGLYGLYSKKKCPICKKIFIVQDCSEYGYKLRQHGTKNLILYFCSWSCMRAYEKKKTGKSEAKKKELIQKQLSGEVMWY